MAVETKQLEALLTYTTFHIGMYATLITALLGLLATDFLKVKAEVFSKFLWATLVLFVLAGAAGGLVGSSIPTFKSYEEFKAARLGPWCATWFQSETVVHLEHTFFWLGIATAVIGLVASKARTTARSR